MWYFVTVVEADPHNPLPLVADHPLGEIVCLEPFEHRATLGHQPTGGLEHPRGHSDCRDEHSVSCDSVTGTRVGTPCLPFFY